MCRRKLYSVILACTAALSFSVPALAADGEVRVGYSNSTVTLADEPVVDGTGSNTMYTMLIVPDNFSFASPVYDYIYYIDQIDDNNWDTVINKLSSVGTKGPLDNGKYKVLISADNAEKPTEISFYVSGDHGISNIKALRFEGDKLGSKAFSVALSGYNKETDAYTIQFYYTKDGKELKSDFKINKLNIPVIENGAILTVGYQMNGIPEEAYSSLGARLITSETDALTIDLGSGINKDKAKE